MDSSQGSVPLLYQPKCYVTIEIPTLQQTKAVDLQLITAAPMINANLERMDDGWITERAVCSHPLHSPNGFFGQCIPLYCRGGDWGRLRGIHKNLEHHPTERNDAWQVKRDVGEFLDASLV